jgi:SAM-dependent methyltransferase
MKYCRIANIEDFTEDAELRQVLRELSPWEYINHPDWPTGFEFRKAWEIALAYAAIHEFVPDARRVLGVGAGMEATGFHLTRLCEVHMTDLYCEPGMWESMTPRYMLDDPQRCAPPIKWNPLNMVVQHMDGRNLRYPDNSFDAVFSSSSIEHFGTFDDVAQAAREMGRVVRPGGLITLATEYLIDGPAKATLPFMVMFNEQSMQKYLVEPSGCELIEPLDTHVSQATLDIACGLKWWQDEFKRTGKLHLPHLTVKHKRYTFGSFHIVMRKPIDA